MGVKLQIFSIVTSLLLTTIGLVAVVFGNGFIKSFVSSNLKLVPSTDLYKQWLDPPIDVYLNFHIFNLKNPLDFIQGARPVVEEIGPFVYREYIKKDDIVDNLNYTISYKERKYYKFVPELSPYPESYVITSINMAPIALLDKIKFQPDLVQSLVSGAFQALNETLLVTKPANEILFGYKDNLLTFLKKFNVIDGNLIPSEYVGLFYGKNDTYEGVYTIYSGADDVNKLGIIEKFNFQDNVNFWSTSYANMINGTDGTLYAPFLNKSNPVFIFNNDICRSIYINYNETIHTLNNIEIYGYKPDPYFFEDHIHNPDNGGFCTPADNCLGAGVLNLTGCVGGIPIIMSNPHFLYGDPKYIGEVDGLNPNESLHLTSLYIEPTTGVPMQANKRIQFNTKLKKNPRINITKNLPEVLFPLFWVDENFKIDQKIADQFKNQVMIPLAVLNYGKYVLLGVGSFMLLLSSIYTIRSWRKSKKNNKNSLLGYRNSMFDDDDDDKSVNNGSVVI